MKKIRGFTMIELLIVIAVLGILAIAVLAAINPIEQINRGRDTGNRSDAEQLLSAIDRYNASQMLWPWQADSDDSPSVTWQRITATQPSAPNGCSMLDNLRYDPSDPQCPGTDEIKQSFANRITTARYNALYMEYGGQPGDSVYICFSPQSMAFSQEADRRCENPAEEAMLPDTACGGCGNLPGATGKNDNCICLP